MAVPTTGNFLMFGTGSNTTIAGAIIEGGASSETVASTLNFNALKSLADINKFDVEFKEGATTLEQIVKSTQFRGYPIFKCNFNGLTIICDSTTTTTTISPCGFNGLTIICDSITTTTTTTTEAPITTTTASPTTTTTSGICVTLFGASMAPCQAGTQDDHMEGFVSLSSNTTVDAEFTLEVKYIPGSPSANCSNLNDSIDLFVTVPAGTSEGLLNCSNGAPFIDFGGATICSVTITDGPYPLCAPSTTTTTTAAPTTTTTTITPTTTTTTTTAAPTTTTTTATPTTTTTASPTIFTHGAVRAVCSDYCTTNYNITTLTLADANYDSLTIGDTIYGQGGVAGFVAYSNVSTDTTTGPFRIAEIDSSGVVVSIKVCVGGSCEVL